MQQLPQVVAIALMSGRVRSFHTVHFNDADRPTFIAAAAAAAANLASLYSGCCLFVCFCFSFQRACFVPTTTTAVNVFNGHGRIIF